MLKKNSLLVLILILWACGGGDKCEQYLDNPSAPVSIDFTDRTHEIHEIASQDEMETYFAANPIIRDYFFEYGDLPSEASFHSQVLRFVTTPKVQDIFGAPDVATLEELLEKNRDIRDLLAIPYLSAKPGRSLYDLHDLLKSSTITSLNSLERIGLYLDKYPEEREMMALAFNFITKEELDEENFETLKNPYVDTLYQEVFQLIDGGQLRFDLDRAYARVKEHFSFFNAPKIEMIYSGFGRDIFISDSLLVIGIDYYLGEEASFRPNVYDYLKARLTPEHLVPQIMQFTSLQFNSTKEDKRSLLEEMIYYGKALEFASEMLPCTAPHLIMGFTPQQMANAELSEAIIWNYFLDNKLIYSENPNNVSRYISERPSVPEIDKICPGRIGQWVGWQIVKKYREESDMSFEELMKETNAQKILTQSKYKPRLR